MINLDFLTLKAFFIENTDFIINSRLQKIQQPTRRDFIFSLRNNGVSKKLYININPQIYHIAFMSQENETNRGLVIPLKPPMFCMLLRKYLEGARICDANVVNNERILELFFDTYDEIGEQRFLTLAIELMGKHSNIILYDRSTKVIIGCAHNVGAEKSRYRELQGGLNYIYPPSESIHLSNELKLQFKNLSETEIQTYLNIETFSPALYEDKYTLFSELVKNPILQESVNKMLDDYYSKIQKDMNLRIEKSKLLEITESKLKKVKNATNKILELLKKRDNTEKYKLFADLLTANLYQKADYQKSIEVYDYIHDQNIIIELDPLKTLSENAQKYYGLFTKSKTTKAKSQEMLENLKIERDYLENIIYSINSAESYTELNDIKQELGIEEGLKKKFEKTTKPDLLKVIIDGFEIYIGKNNKQNDYIVSKLAKDEDLWFHTKNCAGSHVLLKIKELEPNEQVIYECCKLARKFSSASMPSKVGIIYTKAANLKKPPGSPLGYVTYKNEKEILV